MRTAVLITLAALLDLFAAFLMIAGRPRTGTLAGFLLAEMGLIACAIHAWVKYFKEYVNFEIETRLRNTGQEALSQN